MPTYTEALFEPLEAWIAREVSPAVAHEDNPRALGAEAAADQLRLIVAKMLLEHAGRGDRPVVKS